MELLDILIPAAIVLVVINILLALSEGRTKREIARHARRIEDKVDLLVQHAGVAPPADPRMAEVTALARSGKKIQAIALYRKLTDVDLAEAKAAVDQLA
jgi:ribosomal protein L7/L12